MICICICYREVYSSKTGWPKHMLKSSASVSSDVSKPSWSMIEHLEYSTSLGFLRTFLLDLVIPHSSFVLQRIHGPNNPPTKQRHDDGIVIEKGEFNLTLLTLMSGGRGLQLDNLFCLLRRDFSRKGCLHHLIVSSLLKEYPSTLHSKKATSVSLMLPKDSNQLQLLL